MDETKVAIEDLNHDKGEANVDGGGCLAHAVLARGVHGDAGGGVRELRLAVPLEGEGGGVWVWVFRG